MIFLLLDILGGMSYFGLDILFEMPRTKGLPVSTAITVENYLE